MAMHADGREERRGDCVHAYGRTYAGGPHVALRRWSESRDDRTGRPRRRPQSERRRLARSASKSCCAPSFYATQQSFVIPYVVSLIAELRKLARF
jgi:hypothetical protein